ncbi:hypothetical protein MPSEU_000534400 [Mayamaea pseudoterrestris]|nr:hypothetical protein MPSEU_000534400 [Mayamaea pseudoterrestris]
MIKKQGHLEMMSKEDLSATFGDSWDYDHESATLSAGDGGSKGGSLYSSPSFDWSSSSELTKNLIKVSVTGVVFMIESGVFDKLKRLPWDWSDNDDCLFLQTSPDLFEIVLNHLIFESFPVSLNRADIEELEPMAIVLGLRKLETHLVMLNKHLHWGSRRRFSQRSGSSLILTKSMRSPSYATHLHKMSASTRHWAIARTFFAKKQHRTLEEVILDADCLS